MPANEQEEKFDLSRIKRRSSSTINYYLRCTLAKSGKAGNTPCRQASGDALPHVEEPSGRAICHHFPTFQIACIFSASSQTHKNLFARGLTVAWARLESKAPERTLHRAPGRRCGTSGPARPVSTREKPGTLEGSSVQVWARSRRILVT